MKIEILDYTKNPLDKIGMCAMECYGTIPKDNEHYSRVAKHCLRSGHFRNMELASLTVKITASARMIREFYSHIGGNPTRLQSSTRYINYNNFDYIVPNMTEEQEKVYKETMEGIREGYAKLKELGCKNDITGYVLPLGMESVVVCNINARTLMNMFNQRLCNRALLEYRQVMHQLKNEIIDLGEQWQYIALNYFKVKCEVQGYCQEDYPCNWVKYGLVKSKKEFDLMIKGE